MIVAYTDGATDFSSDPVDPLDKFLREVDARDAASVASAVEARAISGRSAPRDDIAVVAVQFNGQPVSPGTADAADDPGQTRRGGPVADGAVGRDVASGQPLARPSSECSTVLVEADANGIPPRFNSDRAGANGRARAGVGPRQQREVVRE